jgi:hypothetical protein
MRKLLYGTTILAGLAIAGAAQADVYLNVQDGARNTTFPELNAPNATVAGSAQAAAGINSVNIKDVQPGTILVEGTDQVTASLENGEAEGFVDIDQAPGNSPQDPFDDIAGDNPDRSVGLVGIAGNFSGTSNTEGGIDGDTGGEAPLSVTGDVTFDFPTVVDQVVAPGDLYVNLQSGHDNSIGATANLRNVEVKQDGSAGTFTFVNSMSATDKGDGASLAANVLTGSGVGSGNVNGLSGPRLDGARAGGEDIYVSLQTAARNNLGGVTNAANATVRSGGSLSAAAIVNNVSITDRGCSGCEPSTIDIDTGDMGGIGDL